MKKFLYPVLCLTLLSAVSCGTKNNSDEWQVVWEDDFNQTEHFDESKWSKISRGTPDWRDCMSFNDNCFAMRDGNLVLRGIVNDVDPADTSKYLTGGVYTKGKVAFSNGRIDIRARFSSAKGAWPALWMKPVKPDSIKWPMAGEIDIMEHLNYDTIAYQTVHSNYTHHLGIKEPVNGATGAICRDDYNIYSVEMYRDSLVFFINNQKTFFYPRIETDKEGQFPFADRPFYLLLDMQLGGAWVGEVNPEDLPAEMEIDWVRFSQKKKDIR